MRHVIHRQLKNISDHLLRLKVLLLISLKIYSYLSYTSAGDPTNELLGNRLRSFPIHSCFRDVIIEVFYLTDRLFQYLTRFYETRNDHRVLRT